MGASGGLRTAGLVNRRGGEVCPDLRSGTERPRSPWRDVETLWGTVGEVEYS